MFVAKAPVTRYLFDGMFKYESYQLLSERICFVPTYYMKKSITLKKYYYY